MNKEEIQQQIDEITHSLKEMSSNDPDYARLWDKRVDLKWKLKEL